MNRKLLVLLTFALAAATTRVVFACAVPVFRYALEQWPAEPYPVTVFHQGALAAADRECVERLGASNLVYLQTCDVAGLTNWPSEVRDLWGRASGAGTPPLPLVIVEPPYSSGTNRFVWSGPLTTANVDGLVQSAERRELTTRLLHGDTAVWLLFVSGDAAADRQARETLSNALARAKAELVLPHQVDEEDAAYDSPVATNVPLVLRFSVLEVAPGSAEAALLRSMLVPLMESQSPAPGAGPLAVPVFGRGRALDVLGGERLNADEVLGICAFLTGPCSCMVKEMNPGLDLFVSADWESVVGGMLTVTAALPPLRVPGAAPRAPAGVAAPAAEPVPAGAGSIRATWAVVAVLVGLAAVGSLLVLRRGGTNR